MQRQNECLLESIHVPTTGVHQPNQWNQLCGLWTASRFNGWRKSGKHTAYVTWLIILYSQNTYKTRKKLSKLTKDSPPQPTYRSKVKVILRLRTNTTCYLNVIQFGVPMSKSIDSNSWWKYNFAIEVNGQSHTAFINVRDTLYHCDTLTC